jgi:hypothetical protein
VQQDDERSPTRSTWAVVGVMIAALVATIAAVTALSEIMERL